VLDMVDAIRLFLPKKELTGSNPVLTTKNYNL